MSDLSDFRTALQRSPLSVASRILELSDEQIISVSLDSPATYNEIARTLISRVEVKKQQAQLAASPVSWSRFEAIGSAISSVLAWWSEHQSATLRYVCLDSPPDITFVLWFNPEDGALVGGFESRVATKLSYVRGKEFFGGDWEPVPGAGL